MENVLEHFVHMVLCKCAVVLIKAESMKPSLSDAVWQGKNAETIISKGNTFPNKDIFKKNNPTNKTNWKRFHVRFILCCPPVSTFSHRLHRKSLKAHSSLLFFGNWFLFMHWLRDPIAINIFVISTEMSCALELHALTCLTLYPAPPRLCFSFLLVPGSSQPACN